MLLLRGPRGLVFIFVILIFVTTYYYSRLSVDTTEHESDFVGPQQDGIVAEHERLQPPKSKPDGITTLSSTVEKVVRPTQIGIKEDEYDDSENEKENDKNIQPISTPVIPIPHKQPITDNAIEAVIPSTAPSTSLSPSDILLIVKTGASTVWRRMPAQLTTTLSKIPHKVIYSDLHEDLSYETSTIDVLSNVSEIIRIHDPTAYNIYQSLQTNIHAYREQAQLPGDEPPTELTPSGNQPGWVLDRYKFLPMLAHAYQAFPNAKWTVYIEDDTYIFWGNLLQWLDNLSTRNDEKPSYWGAFSGNPNATFAQGGSGIVFSHSLMHSLFSGPNIPTLEKYAKFTADSCCGDMVLGKVLADYGVLVNGGDYGPVSFRPEPPWKTAFEEFLWCVPIFSFHHLHQKDLVQLMRLEREHVRNGLGSRPLLFRDIFLATISPYLIPRRPNWDNFASRYLLTSNQTTLKPSERFPTIPTVHNITVLETAYQTPDACQAACMEVDICRMWKHEIDNEGEKSCALDPVVILGREFEGREVEGWRDWDRRIISSGWVMERIEGELMKDNCEVVVQP